MVGSDETDAKCGGWKSVGDLAVLGDEGMTECGSCVCLQGWKNEGVEVCVQ